MRGYDIDAKLREDSKFEISLSKEEKSLIVQALTLYQRNIERVREVIRQEVREGKTPRITPTQALEHSKSVEKLKQRFAEEKGRGG